jgi:hypothetical protein
MSKSTLHLDLHAVAKNGRTTVRALSVSMKKPKETKICAQCKLPFENRKSWKLRGQWDEIKYCSDRCRKAAKHA